MKIPRRKFLVAGTIIGMAVSGLGTTLAVVSSYLNGKRDAMNEIIDIGLNNDRKGLSFYEHGKLAYRVHINAETIEGETHANT